MTLTHTERREIDAMKARVGRLESDMRNAQSAIDQIHKTTVSQSKIVHALATRMAALANHPLFVDLLED